MMENELVIADAGPGDISIIGSLAYRIWPEAYKQILSVEQLNYMLELLYSEASLKDQMINRQHHFIIARIGRRPVGFASFSPMDEAGIFKLHKLYVSGEIQGRGIGRALIGHILEQIIPLQAKTLRLNVNRMNSAKYFYERLGFSVVGEEDIPIGNGYFMNDFIMEKAV